jgi:hypothetical protein
MVLGGYARKMGGYARKITDMREVLAKNFHYARQNRNIL